MNELKRGFSPFAVWGLSFGFAVGWGAFIMPGMAFLPSAGPLGTLTGILVGALAMAIIGWNYHKMTSAFPGPSGACAFAARAFGADYGFLTAWSLLLSYMVILWVNASALDLLARFMFGGILQFGWHSTRAEFDTYLGEVLFSVGVMVVAGLVCFWGRRLAGRVQAVLAAFMLVGVAACFFAALSHHEGGVVAMAPAFSPVGSGHVTQVLHILAMMPWAFVGFEAVSHVSGEFRFPAKRLWWIFLAAIAASAAMYGLLAFLPVLAHPDQYASWADYVGTRRNFPGIDAMATFTAARTSFGRCGIALIGMAMFAAIFTGIVGATIVMSRLVYSLAVNDILPKGRWLGRLDANGSPRNAILFVVGISLVIPFFGRTMLGWPVDVSSIGAAVAYCCTSAAAYSFARKSGDALTKVTGLAGTVMSVVFCLLLLVPNNLMGNVLSAQAYFVLTLWCVVGFALYRQVFKHDARRRFGRSPVVWTGFVVLILFSSLMWVRISTQQATSETADSIVAFQIRHCTEVHGSTNAEALRYEQAFVAGAMDRLGKKQLGYDIVQLALFAVSLVIIFNVYIIQRRRQDELEIANTKAEAREKAKNLFFSTVSHDIRTPLNAIIGFSEMLQNGLESKSERELAVNSILMSSRTLLELVNDILDLSKLESGRMDITPEPTDVARLVGEITLAFEATHKAPGLKVLCHAEGVPHLMVDPHRLRQIAFNLMGNALKFTKKGFVELRASFEPGETGDRGLFRLSVKDTGCGISKEDLKKLALPYVQVGEATARRGGTGLGLHICRMLARAMGGDMKIESELGKGSTFSVTIPAEVAVDGKPEKPDSPENPDNPEIPVAPASLRILVAEDTKMNQMVLKTMFRKLGVTDVTFADNGCEAMGILTAPDAPKFDFVLTDAYMPVMTGMELIAEIRANPSIAKMPVYLFTAEVEMKDAYAAAGFDGILLKPADLESLRKLIS